MHFQRDVKDAISFFKGYIPQQWELLIDKLLGLCSCSITKDVPNERPDKNKIFKKVHA